MKRFLVAIFVTLCFWAMGEIAQSHSEGLEQPLRLSYLEANEAEAQLQAIGEYSSEMLHSPTSTGIVNAERSTTTSLRHHLRNRNLVQQKSFPSNGTPRLTGQTSNIFSYNIFRAVLCVKYYLHSLCRLRI